MADTLGGYDIKGECVRYAAALKPLLDLPRGAHILEAGCGSGRLLRVLAALGFTQLVGLEISPRRLELVRKLGPRSARLVCDGGVPFGASTFDAVVAAAVIEHVRDPRQWLGELARVLRPGGTLSLVTDTYMWFWMQRLGMYRSIQPLDRAVWPATLLRWARQAGLRLQACGGFHNMPGQRWYFLRQWPQLPLVRRLRSRWAYLRGRYLHGLLADGRQRARSGAAKPAATPEEESAAILAALEALPRHIRFGRWRCVFSYECFYWFRKA